MRYETKKTMKAARAELAVLIEDELQSCALPSSSFSSVEGGWPSAQNWKTMDDPLKMILMNDLSHLVTSSQ